MTLPIAVLASGSGSNLSALLDGEGEAAGYRVELVVTDRPCAAEERGRARGREVRRVHFGGRAQDEIGRELLGHFRALKVEAVLLAGFLRLLPANVCEAYAGRALNIHPALLPAFGGKGMYGGHVHKAVLRSGAKLSGPTVHYVTAQYDRGPILAQLPVPIRPDDTPATLAARVLRVEHILYPAAAAALARSLIRGDDPPTFSLSQLGGVDDSPQGEDADLRRQVDMAFGTFRPSEKGDLVGVSSLISSFR